MLFKKGYKRYWIGERSSIAVSGEAAVFIKKS